MAKPLTADDVLPIVASLTPHEQLRLVRLIATGSGASSAVGYRAIPVGQGEFSSDDEPLSWDSGGWETLG